MKYFHLLCLISVSSLNVLFSQTIDEQQSIIDTYKQESIVLLKENMRVNNYEKSTAIKAFLSNNKNAQLIKNVNGINYYLVDVQEGSPIYRTVDNVNSAKATRTNFLHNGGGLGLNLEGQNMYVGVWDENHALYNHVEFTTGVIPVVNRVTTPDFTAPGNYDDHATHVTGTIIARGADPLAKGMAPQAYVVSYDWVNDTNEVVSEIEDNALLISNHSYGVPVLNSSGAQNAPTWMMGNYNSDAALWDQIAYTFPYYLQVTSAGNSGLDSYTGGSASGYDKLTGEKNAKNNLVVANAANPAVSASGDLLSLTINPSSSQGPSDDGRIKPDITGDGTGVYSTISTSINSYGSSTGTSMSSPNVAGSLILLQQYYNNLKSQYMKSATLKGLVCHTADDDDDSVGPDPIFGWGLLNMKKAAEVLLDNEIGNSIVSELNLQEGQTYSKSFSASGSSPISVTICWTDPAGVSQAGTTNSTIPALVNDLDLRLRDPGGFIVHQPWKLLAFNINAGATKGDNLVDTVERIDVNIPVAGTYTIEVTHKGSLTNLSQDFSLILTAPGLTLSNEEFTKDSFTLYPNPNNGQFNISFNNGNSEDVKIDIYDISGRLVYNEFYVNNSIQFNQTINLNGVTSGVYIANITQGTNTTSQKIIIE